MTTPPSTRTEPAAPDEPASRLQAVGAPSPLAGRTFWLILGAITAIGFGVRAVHILGSDFPLNDGGLFFAMARDLQAHHYLLPAFTSYNGGALPFAYPPLGFYLAALLDDWTPFALIDLFRLLPLLYSSLTIVAFGVLARRLLQSDIAALAAAVAFALVPRSFIWLLMGGGVARALGLLLALLALHEAYRLYTTGRRRYLVSGALLSAATVLSHVETAWFLAFSIVLLFLTYGRTRQQLANSVVLAGAATLLAAPWWIRVVATHGLAPFLHANGTVGSVFSDGAMARELFLALARVTATSEPLFPLIGALSILGALVAIRARQFMLPVWWVLIILLDARAFPTFTTIPVALLAGHALVQIVLPLTRRSTRNASTPVADRSTPATFPALPAARDWRGGSLGTVLIGGTLLLYMLGGSLVRAPGFGGEGHFLVGLTSGERAAFEWIDANTPATSRILILPRGPWPADKEGEWLPVLTARVSAATVQGSEWTGRFEAQVRAYDAAWSCGYGVADCLGRWSSTYDTPFTHLYIPSTDQGQCCGTLLVSLRQSAQYSLLYEGPGGTIFGTHGPLAPLASPASPASPR